MDFLNENIASFQPKISVVHAAELLGITVQAIHKQLKQKNITCNKYGNKSYLTYLESRDLFNFNFEKKSVALQIVKGGTGKTTSVVNMSACMNAYGANVLIVDIDPQGNTSDTLRVNADDFPVMVDFLKGEATAQEGIVNIYPGLDVIPSRIENVVLDSRLAVDGYPLQSFFSNILEGIANNYDVIIIDCPPTLGHTVTAASLYSDLVIAPLNPDQYSVKGLEILKRELLEIASRFKTSIEYRVFLNKFSGNTILSDKAISQLISDPELDGKILQTAVRASQEIPNITDEYKSLFSGLKKSTARSDFDQLTRELFNVDVKTSKALKKEDYQEVIIN